MIPKPLITYIETAIIPRYKEFDKAHNLSHVRTVIEESLALARQYPEADERLAYVIAAYHDTGLCRDRATHHLVSGEILMADSTLRQVPISMNYDDPYQDLHIHFSAGMQHLSGAEALKVVRFRHNNDGSGYGSEDIGRMQTQQNFLKAVAQQTLTLSNVDKVGEFAKIFQQYVDTDLSLGNLAWLGKEAISMGVDKISFSTLPNEWRSPYIYLDPDATLELVNQYLNPYVEDRTMEDLDIPS